MSNNIVGAFIWEPDDLPQIVWRFINKQNQDKDSERTKLMENFGLGYIFKRLDKYREELKGPMSMELVRNKDFIKHECLNYELSECGKEARYVILYQLFSNEKIDSDRVEFLPLVIGSDVITNILHNILLDDGHFDIAVEKGVELHGQEGWNNHEWKIVFATHLNEEDDKVWGFYVAEVEK